MKKDTLSLVECLGSDMACRILSYLYDPIDLAHLTIISRSCHRIGKYFTFLCSSVGFEPLTYGHIHAGMDLISTLPGFLTFAW